MNTALLKKAASAVAIGLCLIGLIGITRVAWQQFTGQAPCPVIVAIPVCYPLLLAYAGLSISVIFRSRYQTAYFFTAWLPIVSFALTGSILESFSTDTCPRAIGNIPACYYSLAISLLILIFFWLSLTPKFRTKTPS